MNILLKSSKALAKSLVEKATQVPRHTTQQAIGKLRGHAQCPACGHRAALVFDAAMWPELIEEWEISPQWAAWFDQREGCRCAHCDSNLRARQLARALVDTINLRLHLRANSLAQLCHHRRAKRLKVAEINSAGNLHPFLQQLPGLRYSEYGSQNPNVPSEDLMKLSYPDTTFDYVITSETLEHVPDVDVVLKEIHRILKPNGAHIFTVPIVEEQTVTRQRASLNGGQLIHHLPPSYHGAPATGKEDFLVFSEFGGDFIERVRQAGFRVKLARDKNNPTLITFVTHRL